MKATKFFILKLLVFTFMISFISCSSESESNNIDEGSIVKREASIENANNFLNSFYKDDYYVSNSIETFDENIKINVFEISLNTNLNTKGYLAIEAYTNKLLYFVNVDRTNNLLTIKDFTSDEYLVKDNIDKLNIYLETNNFDFIKIIENYNNSSSSYRRFWGWSCGAEYSIEPGSCYRNCVYYVLGMATPVELTAYPDPVFTCSNLPGSNPKLN